MKTRRGFFRTILAAPVAAYAAFRGGTILVHSLPLQEYVPLPKLTRIQGRMAITGDAMKAIYGGGRGGGKTEFQRQLNRVMSQHLEEVDRFYGLHEMAVGDDSGVRKVGGAGAYPSEVTGA